MQPTGVLIDAITFKSGSFLANWLWTAHHYTHTGAPGNSGRGRIVAEGDDSKAVLEDCDKLCGKAMDAKDERGEKDKQKKTQREKNIEKSHLVCGGWVGG